MKDILSYKERIGQSNYILETREKIKMNLQLNYKLQVIKTIVCNKPPISKVC